MHSERRLNASSRNQMALKSDRPHSPEQRSRRIALISKDSKAATALTVRSTAGASKWPCVGSGNCGFRPCFQVRSGKAAGVQSGLQEALGEQGRGHVFGAAAGQCCRAPRGAPEAAAREAMGAGALQGLQGPAEPPGSTGQL